ncbi:MULTISPECIES: hypothetical protein [unclassified Streptomyces]|uniref:hypothetical protein n=1 Tax=unclassified Streptomyces TaxID=2593676 RepID=UPI0022533654|nr:MULTISPECIES: hypothetical protein [unclassified Streptomyces]MCX4883938.1 hypothetical protein [Streptomyces sp. NBC_00847]MCX5424053.1 hypothetical protein [Streptomyces sp. NBC_00078]
MTCWSVTRTASSSSPLIRTGQRSEPGPESNFLVVFPVARPKPMVELELIGSPESLLRRKTWPSLTAMAGRSSVLRWSS